MRKIRGSICVARAAAGAHGQREGGAARWRRDRLPSAGHALRRAGEDGCGHEHPARLRDRRGRATCAAHRSGWTSRASAPPRTSPPQRCSRRAPPSSTTPRASRRSSTCARCCCRWAPRSRASARPRCRSPASRSCTRPPTTPFPTASSPAPGRWRRWPPGATSRCAAPAPTIWRSRWTRSRRPGGEVEVLADGFRVAMDRRPKSFDVVTLPYPGLATDLQPQAIAALSIADGTAMITENLFEARFMFCDEIAPDGCRRAHRRAPRRRAGARPAVRGAGARHRHPRWRRPGDRRAGGRGRHRGRRDPPHRPRLRPLRGAVARGSAPTSSGSSRTSSAADPPTACQAPSTPMRSGTSARASVPAWRARWSCSARSPDSAKK